VLQAFLPYLRIRRRILKSRFRGIFECISAENTFSQNGKRSLAKSFLRTPQN
jgi:hypothetical protein